MLDFDLKDLGALGGITIFAGAVGAFVGFILIAWLRLRLKGIFVEHADLNGVKADVAIVRTEVAGVKGQIEEVSSQLGDLKAEVHALPTNEDLRTIRHDVKGLLSQNAALGATMKGQGEQLNGIDDRLQLVLESLIKGGRA